MSRGQICNIPRFVSDSPFVVRRVPYPLFLKQQTWVPAASNVPSCSTVHAVDTSGMIRDHYFGTALDLDGSTAFRYHYHPCLSDRC